MAEFLDRALERHREPPGAEGPVAALRYMRFPGAPLSKVADTRAEPPEIAPHPAGEFCPAVPPRPRGTVVAKVWGRALGEDGEPSGDCNSQENYIEDLFDIPTSLQADLARAVAGAGGGGERARVPDALARLLATHAYLGQLDVRPVQSPVPDTRTETRTLELWAAPAGRGEDGSLRLRISGRSDVRGTNPGRRGDGASSFHEIALDWRGSITLAGERITEVLLLAEGREKLRWGNPAFRRDDAPDVARLPAGRPIDIDTRVRYGIAGEPVAAELASDGVEEGRKRPPRGGPASSLPPDLRALVDRLRLEVERLVREGKEDEAERLLDRILRDLRRP